MDSIDELAAKEAVRDVITRWFLAGDEGRADDLAALCTEEAVLSIRIPAAGAEGRSWEERGRAAIAKHAQTFQRAIGFIRHHATTCLVEIHGDKATASSYFQAFNEAGLHHFGRLDDDFVLSDGTWLIIHRTATTTFTKSRGKHEDDG